MVLSLLPVAGVWGVDAPNGPVGVCGAPPPKLSVKPCCTAGDVGCPAPEPNPNGFGADCCGGALVGPANGNGVDGAGANCWEPNAGLAGADPKAPPLAGELNANGLAVAGCWGCVCPKVNPVEEDGRAGSGGVCPNVKLVECWIGSGALKENPEDVASAVLGPGWLKENPEDVASAVLGPGWLKVNPVESEGLLSVVELLNVNPADGVFSAGFDALNENPPLELSDAFVFVPKVNPPLVPWLED